MMLIPALVNGKTKLWRLSQRFTRRKNWATVAKNNGKQRGKQLGGCTGRGFLPGASGNPNGRPRTSGLLNVLRSRLTQQIRDGRTIEEVLVDSLLEEATDGRNGAAAIRDIFDRIEGKPRQQLEVTSTTTPFDGRTYEDVRFFSVFGVWPEVATAAGADPAELLRKATAPLNELDSILREATGKNPEVLRTDAIRQSIYASNRKPNGPPTSPDSNALVVPASVSSYDLGCPAIPPRGDKLEEDLLKQERSILLALCAVIAVSATSLAQGSRAKTMALRLLTEVNGCMLGSLA